MINKNQMLKWQLSELESQDGDDIESNEIEIFGEDEHGNEGSFTAEITEIAASALKRIHELETDLGLLRTVLGQTQETLKSCEAALQERDSQILEFTAAKQGQKNEQV